MLWFMVACQTFISNKTWVLEHVFTLSCFFLFTYCKNNRCLFFLHTARKKISSSLSITSLLITLITNPLSDFQNHLFSAPQPDKDNSRNDTGLGMEERGRSVCTHLECQVKLFLHFILLAPYLFNCLSAPLLGYVQAPAVRFSVCLCASSAKERRQAACCVKGCRGNFQTLSQRGIVCEIQMLETAPLFAYCYHCSLAYRRTDSDFDLTREKQNDKLSHQLSSNTPPTPACLSTTHCCHTSP